MKKISLVLMLLSVLAFPVLSGDDVPSERDQPPLKRRPLVVMKQATITGRVFLLSEEEQKDEVLGASDLRIRVQVKGERKPIYTTKTDDEGRYTLPNLEIGVYILSVGRLKLELSVEEPGDEALRAKQIPKTIIIFIPESMTW